MITVAVNPNGIAEEYLKCLNVCFSGWGDRQKYDWYFRRKTAYPDADLMILKQDNNLAAGSAVTYRRVAFANDSEVTVGIMTGSWTLPQFRNQGCFARIIEESLRLTALKGGALLLGFLTKGDPWGFGIGGFIGLAIGAWIQKLYMETSNYSNLRRIGRK